MKAREIIVEQRSEAWHQARAGRVTASEADALWAVGRGKEEALTRRNYRAQLVAEQLTGRAVSQTFQSAAMKRGIELEAEARAVYEIVTGRLVRTSGFWACEDLQAGASPDGVVVGENVGVELKCPQIGTHMVYLFDPDALRKEYERQCQFQAWVCGFDAVELMSYCPEMPAKLQTVRTTFVLDDEQRARIEDRVRAFLAEVERDVRALTKIAEAA